MAGLASFLTLPTSSSAFGKASNDESSSPIHKIPRLDADADVSRSRASRLLQPADQAMGMIYITVTGDEPVRRLAPNFLVIARDRMTKVLSEDPLIFSYNEVFNEVFNACRAAVCKGQGPQLHGYLKAAFQGFASSLAKWLCQVPVGETTTSVEWLVEFEQKCQLYHDRMHTIQSLYACLDQLYVLKQKGAVDTIELMALGAFSDSVLSQTKIADRLRTGISDWALWERTNERAHPCRANVATVITQLQMLGQFPELERHYLTSTAANYSDFAKAREGFTPRALFDYLHQQMEQDFERSKAVFPLSSWNNIRNAAEQAFLGPRMELVAQGTVGSFIKEKNWSMSATLYQMFQRSGSLDVLQNHLRTFVVEEVSSIVLDTDKTGEGEMVSRLLEFNTLCQGVSTQAFVDTDSSSTRLTPNDKFKQAIQEGWRSGFQKRKNKPAEMIARYLDKIMRRGQRGATDQSFHQQCDEAMALYRFTDDKDVFRTFYHRQFARRMLTGRVASSDIEKAMMTKLKTNYDAEFGVGEEMFKDLALSGDMIEDWHRKLDVSDAGRKLNVFVLQHSVWPFNSEKVTLSLPVKMQDQLSAFTRFYEQKHKSRKLEWYHSLASVELRARFKHGDKDLSMSLYQTCIVLLFNNEERLSYDTIKAHLGLTDADLVPALQSMACGKKRILKKDSPGKDVKSGDQFEVNTEFKDPKVKVHVNMIQTKVTEQESEQTQGEIDNERKYTIQAAIVRIMKGKQHMLSNPLRMAVIDAVKMHFVPSIELIKSQIEWCVDSDYMERDEENKNLFKYIA